MHTFGIRVLGALAIVVAGVAGVGHSASATGPDLLAGHGNFEKPAESGLGATFAPGAVFDGWTVSTAKVALFRAVGSVITPPQGNQGLSLTDAFAPPSQTAGTVCRVVPTITGHRYSIPFQAAIADTGTGDIVVKLGTTSKTVALPLGTQPAVFKRYQPTVRAAATRARFCMTATKLTGNAYPAVDAVKVIDLGP